MTVTVIQADALAADYEAISSATVLAQALPFMPSDGLGRLALDVGAGTGRDAAWLSSLGWEVVAVEPAAGMRLIAGRRHPNAGIRWSRYPGRAWQRDYNDVRPHSKLGWLTPSDGRA